MRLGVLSPYGATSLGAWLLAMQAGFSRALQAAVSAVKDGRDGAPTLVGLGFAYGVLHAAGPVKVDGSPDMRSKANQDEK